MKEFDNQPKCYSGAAKNVVMMNLPLPNITVSGIFAKLATNTNLPKRRGRKRNAEEMISSDDANSPIDPRNPARLLFCFC